MLLFELDFLSLSTTDSLSHIVFISTRLLTPSLATILSSEGSTKLPSNFVVARIVAIALLISYFMSLLASITFDMLDNSWCFEFCEFLVDWSTVSFLHLLLIIFLVYLSCSRSFDKVTNI